MTLDGILYLGSREVRIALAELDAVAATRDVLLRHARGEAVASSETCLTWSPTSDGAARSLGMPGLLLSPHPVAGTKIINASIANIHAGIPRASGLTLLFDFHTARPVCILEAALISAIRTAAVTVLAAELLHHRPIRKVALIGAGTQAHTHLELFLSCLPALQEIRIFDREQRRATALSERHASACRAHEVTLSVVGDARGAIEGSELLVTVTTTTEGYIPLDWLTPGTTFVNVSLDDPLPEVVLEADTLVIDDWELISSDRRRLLGRLFHSGLVCGPGTRPDEGVRRVDATLGDLLLGRHHGRADPDELVLVNPFGMAIEDLALAHRVYEIAHSGGLGSWLPM
jgi:ornithine cyclodeaminase/alanine dehydrogenase-like protein (mu-crystallin family)